MRPRLNKRPFADDIFKCFFLNVNIWIPINISLNFVPECRINNIPALVQIMAWRRPGDKPLSESMMFSLLTHICVTRPQWVKSLLCAYCMSWKSKRWMALTHPGHNCRCYFQKTFYVCHLFCCISFQISLNGVSHGSNFQWASICLDNTLPPYKQQTFIWNNDSLNLMTHIKDTTEWLQFKPRFRVNDNFWISIPNSLVYTPQGAIDKAPWHQRFTA